MIPATIAGLPPRCRLTCPPWSCWLFLRQASSTNWSIFYCTNHLSASLLPDSTTVGFHKDWIVVQAVLRTGSSNAQSSFYVFDKTNVYAGAVTGPVAVLAHYDPGTVGGELPAWTYDNSQTNFYLLQNANGTNGCLRLLSIWNSNGVPVLANTNVPLYIRREGVTWGDEPPTTNLNRAPQLGANVGINPGYDSRIQNVVTFSASVIGVPQPTNQWRLEGTNLPGATNLTYMSSLSIPPIR